MRKEGCMRALWYFIRQAQACVLLALAGGFAMAAYIWVFQDETFSVQKLLCMVPDSVIYFILIIVFTGSLSSVQNCYYLPVSFGCLRKYAFLGNLAMDGLMIAECLAFYCMMAFWMHMELTKLAYYVAMYLLIEGIAKCMSIAYMKWGKVVYVIVIVATGVFFGIAGFVFTYGRMEGNMISFFELYRKNKTNLLQTGMLAASLLVCIVANVGSWRMIRKLEVRA